jgi:TolB protein
MIYTVDLATRIANQLTFAGIYNASPAWSPKGDKIMFAAQQLMDGNFDLYSIDPDGNNMGRVTRGEALGRHRSNSENPSWAPTGRHIAYSSNESGNPQIFIMTSDGSIRHRISPIDKACETPAWGPPEG